MSIFKEELEAQEKISLEAKSPHDDDYSTSNLRVAPEVENRKKSKSQRIDLRIQGFKKTVDLSITIVTIIVSFVLEITIHGHVLM